MKLLDFSPTFPRRCTVNITKSTKYYNQARICYDLKGGAPGGSSFKNELERNITNITESHDKVWTDQSLMSISKNPTSLWLRLWVLKSFPWSRVERLHRETYVAAMTTSSVVTGCVWDLSCRRRSLCSTAALRERRLGTFFSSNDFSISWNQKHCPGFLSPKKSNAVPIQNTPWSTAPIGTVYIGIIPPRDHQVVR